jgi:hypothetical protein
MDILTTVETHDQLAYTLTLLVTFGIAINQGGAADLAFPQTFAMTFADIATQQPVGELGSFDPATGVGSVVTPDITCGFWAVAAACVGPNFDRDALEAGIRSSGDFLEQIGAPAVSPISPEFEAFAQTFLGSMNTGFDLLIEFATAVGPTLVRVSPHRMRWACRSSASPARRRTKTSVRRAAGRTTPGSISKSGSVRLVRRDRQIRGHDRGNNAVRAAFFLIVGRHLLTPTLAVNHGLHGFHGWFGL